VGEDLRQPTPPMNFREPHEFDRRFLGRFTNIHEATLIQWETEPGEPFLIWSEEPIFDFYFVALDFTGDLEFSTREVVLYIDEIAAGEAVLITAVFEHYLIPRGGIIFTDQKGIEHRMFITESMRGGCWPSMGLSPHTTNEWMTWIAPPRGDAYVVIPPQTTVPATTNHTTTPQATTVPPTTTAPTTAHTTAPQTTAATTPQATTAPPTTTAQTTTVPTITAQTTVLTTTAPTTAPTTTIPTTTAPTTPAALFTQLPRLANRRITADETEVWIEAYHYLGGILEFEREVLRLVNVERAAHGVGQLTMNTTLAMAARFKSQEMANLGYFDHRSPVYGEFWVISEDVFAMGVFGGAMGENIASGQTTSQSVMNAWMNSPGHRANILDPSFTQIGVGLYANRWTQKFR